MNLTATCVFVLLFVGVTIMGFLAAHWRRGDLYTTYTFVAVPALVFGAGAMGFFALPHTILIYPFAFMVFPKLWSIAKHHGYVTSADFVSARYGSRALALAVAVTDS